MQRVIPDGNVSTSWEIRLSSDPSSQMSFNPNKPSKFTHPQFFDKLLLRVDSTIIFQNFAPRANERHGFQFILSVVG
jgi:hypothetical protein